MSHLVAALYVAKNSPYKTLPWCDCWDSDRDAANYDGPLRIVAHPPCGPWGRMKGFNRHQLASHGLRAVELVRKWGGIVEQPADSTLWKATAARDGDLFGGRLYRVEQWHWGHRARKATDLYVVGLHEIPAYPHRPPGDVHPVEKMSTPERERTPMAMAVWLTTWCMRGVA